MWKKRWIVLRRASSTPAHRSPSAPAAAARLEKYRDETVFVARSKVPTVYYLNQLEHVTRLRHSDDTKHRVVLVFTDYSSVQFAADSGRLLGHVYLILVVLTAAVVCSMSECVCLKSLLKGGNFV